MNTDEINEQLGYDADVSDPSQYCRHGTFIGSWWGPDYLCHWCELGEEPPTQAELAQMRHRKRIRNARSQLSSLQLVTEACQEEHRITLARYMALMESAFVNSPEFEDARWFVGRQAVFS